jgi:hypothetical protein
MGSNFFESLFIPWKSEQEDRSEKVEREQRRKDLAAKAQLSASQRAEATAREQEDIRFKALTDLQLRISSKMDQVEEQAEVATGVVLKIRELANNPLLVGDFSVSDLEEILADMEQAVVTIQAGTVVDAASFDGTVLAGAYSNVSAALIAMRTVTARAQGVLKTLESRIRDLKAEKIRLDLAAEEARARREIEARRQEQLAQQRQRDADAQAAEVVRQRRRSLMAQILAVQAELSQEKRRLSSARVELANLRFAQTERQARLAELRSRSSLAGRYR